MKIAIATLKSLSPYNQSRQHFIEMLEKETHEEYEKRTWREKGHYDSDGVAFIPPMALKGSLSQGAKMLSIKVPGKGKNLYTKHFISGVLVTEGISLEIKREDVQPQWLSMSPQGKKGGMGVLRAYPHHQKWAGEATFFILDDTITESVFERCLKEAGNLVGIGQYRPQNGGYFGRFEVEKIKWKEE